MTITKKIIRLTFMVIFASVIVSCSSDNIKSSTVSTSDIESTELNTRGNVSKVASKAYYYNSVASFVNGNSKMDLNDIVDLEGTQVNFVVLYEASAPWAETFNSGKYDITGDDKLNNLMETYQLEIVKQFDIDEDNEGFVLEHIGELLDNPIEMARKLSTVDYVYMVHVKEIPTDIHTVNETVAND